MTANQPQKGTKSGWASLLDAPSFAWFAGVRRDVLAQCPSEMNLYTGLGLAVLLTAAMSSASLMVAIGYVLRTSPSRLWLVGLVWGFVILNVDRCLQILTTSRRLLLAFLPRILISLVIGILIAEPLVLRIFQPEINSQLQLTVQGQVEHRTTAIADYYGSEIKLDQQQTVSMQTQEQSLETQVLHDEFVAACESGETDCSITHELGCGPYCRHYQALTAATQDRLALLTREDAGATTKLHAEIKALSATEARQTNRAVKDVDASNGLIAREDALTRIEHAHPGVLYEVWLIRVVLILLDLLPIIIKFLHVSFGESSYERLSAALKRQEASKAHAIETETRVEVARVSEQGLADEEVDRVAIEIDRDRRIADEEAKWNHTTRSTGASARRGSQSPGRVSAMSLSQYVSQIRNHESMSVPVSSWLRIGGWVGVTLISALTVALAIDTSLSHHMITGAWLVFAMFAAVVSLAAFTKGFREAPAWGLRATFAALIMGLALPIIMLVINL
jgi:hypothetical protein